MGIHKTGSTSVQEESRLKIDQLKEDGYDLPWDVCRNYGKKDQNHLLDNQLILTANQVNLATCFMNAASKPYFTRRYPCVPCLLLAGSEIAQRKRNVFISAEDFTLLDKDGLKVLFAYLSQWDDVTVIIYYRRYYSWLASNHNQKIKDRTLKDGAEKWDLTINDYIARHLSCDGTDYHCESYAYTYFVVKRVKNYFDNIVIMNMHDESKGESSESMFCHAIPDANQTCRAIRTAKKTSVTLNQRQELVYGDLVYGAIKAGLIEINMQDQLDDTIKAVQKYHEETLNLTSKDFKRACLDADQLALLWKKSLNFERALVELGMPSSGENALKADFDKLAKSTLCKLDVELTLQDEAWGSFFRALNDQKNK